MKNTETKRPRRLSVKAARALLAAERTDAAFGMMGREFVKLLREIQPQTTLDVHPEIAAQRAVALQLAEWLYEHRLSDDEQSEFMSNTGWVFDCELRPDPNYREPYDYPRPFEEYADDIPF